MALDHTSDAPSGAKTVEDYTINVSCPTLPRCHTNWLWSYVPRHEDIGYHHMVVEVLEGSVIVGRCHVPIIIAADNGRAIRVAVLGDSLAADGVWIDVVDSILSGITWLGTLGTSAGGNDHDAHNGYSWLHLRTQFDNSPSSGTADSPLLSEAGGAVDVANWITNLGDTPDVVIYAYGINRVFTDLTGNVTGVVDEEHGYAQTIIDTIAAAHPRIVHIFATVPPCSYTEATYAAQYPDPPNDPALQDQYRWVKSRARELVLQQRLWPTQVAIAPITSCLDPINGYGPADAIHPINAAKQANMAECFSAALVCYARSTPNQGYRR